MPELRREILTGHVMDVLQTLPDRSIQMSATSPPYHGLRDYKIPPQDWPAVDFAPIAGLPMVSIPAQTVCLGLEPDPWAFVGHLVTVFREVRRVIRDDGVLFLNLGDSYAGGGRAGRNPSYMGKHTQFGKTSTKGSELYGVPMAIPDGLKAKDMCGIPWRVALALQADGWYLRSDVIWQKPNPMPSSCRDRPTTAHEYIFLLSKSPHYYWDKAAVQEADSGKPSGNGFAGRQGGSERVGPLSGGQGTDTKWTPGKGRNLRSVWTFPVSPYREAHFATWPEALVERMIRASTRPGDVVLDVFAGSGTTGQVARSLGRGFCLIEASPSYVVLATARVDAPTRAEIAAGKKPVQRRPVREEGSPQASLFRS